MADTSPTTIGVDLGGTHLRVARVAASGAVLALRRETTSLEGPDAVVAQIDALIRALRDETTTAVGVGVPGTIDREAGTVLNIPALPGWAGLALAGRLGSGAGLPCRLENDAKAACLGEWRAGAGLGCRDLAYVTVGTGIGGAFVVDGRLLRGTGGLAGEVGHTHVTDDPEPCACGRTGCWQAVASGTALGRAGQAARGRSPGLNRIAGEGPVTAVHVVRAARQGDAVASVLVERLAGHLGMGLANVQHCYAPERIVIGGGLSALLDLLLPGIEAALRQALLPGFRPADIRAAALGDDSGLVGAAMVAAG